MKGIKDIKLNNAINEYFKENLKEKTPFFAESKSLGDTLINGKNILFSGRNMVLYEGEVFWADYDKQQNTYFLKEMNFIEKCKLLKGDDLIIKYKQNASNQYYFDDSFREKLKALKTLGYESVIKATKNNSGKIVYIHLKDE